MKKIAILIILFSFYAAQAQKEFAPIGATWYYTKWEGFNPPKFGYIKHTCIKDSLIEGQRVKVLEKILIPDDTTEINIGHEYLLQKGDTIFYWKNGEFHLLYNFAAQKGDSMLLYSEMLNQCNNKTNYGRNKITSVYSETVNNIELKAYTTTGIDSTVWGFEYPTLEVIGNLEYLFPQNLPCGYYDGFPPYGSLRCYFDDSIGYYQYDPQLSCDSTYQYPIAEQHKLFPKNAKWYYNIQQWFDLKNYGYRLFEVTGDTTIDGQNAVVVKEEAHQHSGEIVTIGSHSFKISSTKADHWKDDSFQPMYNFSLKRGDTLFKAQYDYEACDSIKPYVIDSVTILEVQGIPLKCQHLSTTLYYKPEWGYTHEKKTYKLIEKIGYPDYFIFKPSCFVGDNFGANNSLRCYVDKYMMYKRPGWSYGCDDMITSAKKIKTDNSINLYPLNDGMLQLQVNENEKGILYLYSFDGKQLLKRKISTKETEFCAPSNGILFYRFENEKGEIQTGKVLVK